MAIPQKKWIWVAICLFIACSPYANAETNPPSALPQLSPEELRQETTVVCEMGPARKKNWGRVASKAMIQKGWKSIGEGKSEEAVGLFLLALFAGPEAPGAYWGLGVASHVSGYSLEIIRNCFNAAVKIIPNVADLYADYGRVMFQREQIDEATSLFQKALKLDDNNVSAHVGMAQVHMKANREEKAQYHVERVENLTKSPK